MEIKLLKLLLFEKKIPNLEVLWKHIFQKMILWMKQNYKEFIIILYIQNFQKHIQTRKWHSERADPAKALGPSDILDRDTVIELWPIPKLSISSIMTALLAVLSQKSVFKTGIKFWPHRGSNSRPSRFQHNALTNWVIGPYSFDYYYSSYSPNFIKIRPIVHEKQLSGSQMRISMRITPNYELGLPMINNSLLTKFHQNPTSS